MSNEPKTGKQAPVRRDRGADGAAEHAREAELDRHGVGRTGSIEHEIAEGSEDHSDHDDALDAERENARTSDRTDARDGVDNSDTLSRDPDAAGGKSPR
jgi:hypothetical protein